MRWLASASVDDATSLAVLPSLDRLCRRNGKKAKRTKWNAFWRYNCTDCCMLCIRN
jgi:hypothetical protein